MTLVLDTSVLVAGEPVAGTEQLAISVVTIAELRFGALVAGDRDEAGRRLARLAAVEAEFDPLPVDGAVAASYAHLAAMVHRTGRTSRARSLDLLIASTAHAVGAGVATRNPRDLEGITGEVRVVALGPAAG